MEMNFFRGRVVRCETGALCPMQLQNKSRPGIERSVALEGQTQKMPGVGDEMSYIVKPPCDEAVI